MIRMIILILLAIIAYKLLRLSFSGRKGSLGSGQPSSELPDEMVKDPHCQAYFPKRLAYKTELNGQTLYFCSQECLDAYLNQKREVT